jgi:hypothetical protein
MIVKFSNRKLRYGHVIESYLYTKNSVKYLAIYSPQFVLEGSVLLIEKLADPLEKELINRVSQVLKLDSEVIINHFRNSKRTKRHDQ